MSAGRDELAAAARAVLDGERDEWLSRQRERIERERLHGLYPGWVDGQLSLSFAEGSDDESLAVDEETRRDVHGGP